MKRIATALLVLLLGACGSEAVRLEPSRTYQIDGIGDQPVLAGSHPTLVLAPDGRAYGNGGCNHWFAQYRLDGQQLAFDSMGSTRRLCDQARMAQEQRFFATLQAVRRWEAGTGGELRLWPESGQPLRLRPIAD